MAELRNNADVRSHKLKTLTSENKKLRVEVERYKRDLAQIKEFSTVLEQVESNGQNYLQLMRNLKTYLSTNNDDGAIDDDADL